MIKENLTKIIKESLLQEFPDLEVDNLNIIYQVPKNKDHGDLSTNIAMQLAGMLKSNPRVIAEAIISSISENDIVEKTEIAGPGFLNFYLKKADVFSQLDTMIQEGKSFGQKSPNGEAVNIEYVSVNPTGDLHIGHARGAVYGDVIAKLYAKTGYDVTKEYYINDAGNQIDKLGESSYIRYRQILGEDIPMIEDGYHSDDITRIAQRIVDNHQTELETMNEEDKIHFIREYTLKAELEQIAKDLETIKVHHDVWFSERTLYTDGKITKVLDKLAERKMSFENEGATWLESTKFGDDKDRVLVKTDGSYTYLTPDIAYHDDKIKRLPGDVANKKLVNIWGGDHHGYVARMKAALQTLGYEEDILTVKLIQMVRFIKDGQEFKMSKRSGNAITMRDLIDEVGIDAMRYYFTMRNCDTPLDFDMTLAKETSSSNPVYYVQYAHARICSIIKNAELLVNVNDLTYNNDYSLLLDEKEHALAIKLNQYVDELESAANRLEPFKLTNYIQELAATFHAMYNSVKIVDESNLELTAQRLKLVLATQAVLQSSFEIVGIEAPEQM